MIRLQLEAGLRVSELCFLRVSNLNFIERKVDIENYVVNNEIVNSIKRNSVRSIELTDDLIKELKKYYGSRKDKGFFFLSNKLDSAGKKTHFNSKSIIHFIDKYAIECPNIAHNIGSHTLRRTFASHLFKELDLITISKRLGHKETSTTLKYIFELEPMDSEDVRNAIGKMMNGDE